MSDKFVIQFERKSPGDEEYERKGDNVLQVRLQLPSGEIISKGGYRVELRLSRTAMIGLGSELIRAAHREDVDKLFWHLRPSEKDFASQALGVFLHPESCELLASSVQHGPVDQLHNRS
jgi:hypothetical protein